MSVRLRSPDKTRSSARDSPACPEVLSGLSGRLKGSDDLTVRLGEAYPGVTIYDPTVGTMPVRSLDAATSLKLALSDHPQRENNGGRSHANAHRKK